jgi:4-amino-4-deoxy-L-arabinose transferase-like glycosyltransferase
MSLPMPPTTADEISPTLKIKPAPFWRDGLILVGLWLLAAAFDRTWVWLDQQPPHWDSGDHLSRALNHWRVLQHPDWFSRDWWRTLWEQAPTQRAPLVYLFTAPYFSMFGPTTDAGVTVNLFFTTMVLGSVYAMGRRLFDRNVGLWAAGLSLLAPVMGRLRLDYMLDYGLTAVTAFTAMGLTYWWTAKGRRGQWLFTLLWGAGVGMMLLTRTSALLFVVAMAGWLGVLCLLARQWQRIAQLMAGTLFGIVLIWPWFSTSWLTIISTTISGLAYGVTFRSDPQVNSLAGWLYYPMRLPNMVSSPVLFLALAAGLLALVGWGLQIPRLRAHPIHHPLTSPTRAWLWLGGAILGILALGAAGSNKEPRFLAPLVPLLSVALARLLWWRRDRSWQLLRGLAATTSAVLLLWTTFPVPGATLLPNRDQWFPYMGEQWPHAAMIASLVEASPYLEANLGVIPNSVRLNNFNLGFYGGAANFQVSARELGLRASTAQQDAGALDWYITKSGDQGHLHTLEEARAAINAEVAANPDLEVWGTWPLPDGTEAQIRHRRLPQVEVAPISRPVDRVMLTAVEMPSQISAGAITPVTYRLEGPWKDMYRGLLLLSWQQEDDGAPAWISDHGIGLGRLYGDADPNASFSVVERLGVVPPADLAPGIYRLTATFVDRPTEDRSTQNRYPVQVPALEVEVLPPPAEVPSGPATSPPLDLVTVLRQLSQGLSTGEIDPIFSEVGRIGQYDPAQDYLAQTEGVLDVRLRDYPDQLDWLYGKALAQVLQQDAPGAIASLTRITEVAPDNAYHWAYLGFVHLYAWHPKRAESALNQAASLNPDLPDLKLLQAAAAIMQLQIPKGMALLREGGIL